MSDFENAPVEAGEQIITQTGNNKSLKIVQLYPKDMNIYGDWGNTLSLSRRAQAHGPRRDGEGVR